MMIGAAGGMRATAKAAIAAVVALLGALALMVALPTVAVAAPANDDFASAETISGKSDSVNGNNIGATEETGEAEPRNTSNLVIPTNSSVWYSWTAPETEQVTIDTCTSTFDTVLSVHSGSAVDSLTQVAASDQGCSGLGLNNNGSKLTFNAMAGATYQIRVASWSTMAQGNFTLNLRTASGPPLNDNFADAQPTSGRDSVNGDNIGSTTETGEPDTTDVAQSSVWYRVTVPHSGQVTLDTCTATFDTVLSVYTGSAVDSLTQAALDDDSCTSTEGSEAGSKLTFNATVDTTYYIRVASRFGNPAQGNFTLKLGYPPPPNDNFASFQLMSGEPASVNGSNIGATLETGAGESGFNFPGSKSVWYRWTAPHNGQVAIDTCNSNFDTVLGVYTGRALSSLTRVTQDSSSCTGAEGNEAGSKLNFTTAGATYYIRVSNQVSSAPAGNFTLQVDYVPPPNDNFAVTPLIFGNDISRIGTNVEATTETGEPDTTGVAHSSVWYNWRAPETGQVTLDTCTSDFDTVLSVYTGLSVNDLTQTAPPDDQGCTGVGPNNDGSKLTFEATENMTYRIRVASWAGDPEQGNFTLKLGYVPPPNDDFANAETVSGESTSVGGNNLGATTETGEAGTNFPSTRSVWYSWTAPVTGQATLDTCTSDFDTVLSVRTGSSLGSLTEISSDDEGCFGIGPNHNGSWLSFDATKDTVYYIRVASFGLSTSNMGNFTLDLALTDNVAPDTTITDGPNGLTNDDTPTFSFSGSDNKSGTENLRYAYWVDNGASSEWSLDTSATLDSLPDGEHTFYVVAMDEAGNVDGSPAEQSFTVEKRAPRVETAIPGPGATNASRINDITATFSEPMKASTITTTTVKMKVGRKAVPVAVSLSSDGKTATINPYPADSSRALAPNKKYKVTITTGAQDLSGKALDQNTALSGNQPMVWTFTTGST